MPKRKKKCQSCGRRNGIVTLNGEWLCRKCFESFLSFVQEYLMMLVRGIDGQHRNKNKPVGKP